MEKNNDLYMGTSHELHGKNLNIFNDTTEPWESQLIDMLLSQHNSNVSNFQDRSLPQGKSFLDYQENVYQQRQFKHQERHLPITVNERIPFQEISNIGTEKNVWPNATNANMLDKLINPVPHSATHRNSISLSDKPTLRNVESINCGFNNQNKVMLSNTDQSSMQNKHMIDPSYHFNTYKNQSITSDKPALAKYANKNIILNNFSEKSELDNVQGASNYSVERTLNNPSQSFNNEVPVLLASPEKNFQIFPVNNIQSSSNCDQDMMSLGNLHLALSNLSLKSVRPIEEFVGCVFCKNNQYHSTFSKTHQLKDKNGNCVCPVLRAYICPLCGGSGDSAHTLKYCPMNIVTRGDPISAGLPPGKVTNWKEMAEKMANRRRF